MDSTYCTTSVDAYIAYLTRKQIDPKLIAQRKQFVSEVARHLQKKPHTREAYADTLHKLMHRPSHTAWLNDVTVAREFYPFWMQDIKAIASLSDQYGYDYSAIAWQPLPTSLAALSHTLSQAQFSDQESSLLERYMQWLKQKAIAPDQKAVRIKLAKILLLRLRDAPLVNNLVYRMAVDVTLPVFKQKQSRQLFLEVVREFFEFWIPSTPNN